MLDYSISGIERHNYNLDHGLIDLNVLSVSTNLDSPEDKSKILIWELWLWDKQGRGNNVLTIIQRAESLFGAEVSESPGGTHTSWRIPTSDVPKQMYFCPYKTFLNNTVYMSL